jgi:hypothetical protein
VSSLGVDDAAAVALYLGVALFGCTRGSSSAPAGHEASATPPATARASVNETPAPEDSAVPADRVEPSRCPTNMVQVEGSYCVNLAQRCLEKRKPWQCARFEPPSKCLGDSTAMAFCIDRYEYPNEQGANAAVMSMWTEAKTTCESLGKRLCTDAEWTLACEGPERLPFPYGYQRDATVCNIDKRSPKVNESRLFASSTQQTELERLDQREPSGSRPRCVSPYGVFDLTGNVDEWVLNESRTPYRSALKGGNWGEFRNACRPATRAHDEVWRYYQTGFRCCKG